jgi:hypothetical protein
VATRVTTTVGIGTTIIAAMATVARDRPRGMTITTIRARVPVRATAIVTREEAIAAAATEV